MEAAFTWDCGRIFRSLFFCNRSLYYSVILMQRVNMNVCIVQCVMCNA